MQDWKHQSGQEEKQAVTHTNRTTRTPHDSLLLSLPLSDRIDIEEFEHFRHNHLVSVV